MPQTRIVYLYWLGIYGYLHYGIGGKWGKINYKKVIMHILQMSAFGN